MSGRGGAICLAGARRTGEDFVEAHGDGPGLGNGRGVGFRFGRCGRGGGWRDRALWLVGDQVDTLFVVRHDLDDIAWLHVTLVEVALYARADTAFVGIQCPHIAIKLPADVRAEPDGFSRLGIGAAATD